jgi:hypothetical protein
MRVMRAALAGVLVVAAVVVFIVAGGQPMRRLHALVGGTPAIAYTGPRMEVPLPAGPSQPRVPPGEEGFDPAALALAVEYAGERNTRALVVARGGHVVLEKYWGGATFDSLVDASEFTPVLAALLTGVALHERAIASLDVPVSNYLTEWRGKARGDITLRQLLGGDSGLASAAGWPWPGTPAARYHVGGDLEAALLAWPLDPAQRPGESPADIDAEVLALALQRAFRPARSYELLLAERLWAPLGAGAFSVGRDAVNDRGTHVRAGCCLRARIGDWVRIGQLLANDGVFEGNQLTPPRFVALMMTPARQEAARGFFTHVGGSFAARDIAWLAASGKQRLWVVPSLRLVILRVGGEPPADRGWDEAMIPDSIVRGTSGWRPAAAGEGVDPDRFAPH